ncbi:MAG: dihydrolipoyl dehydrogenase [Candidatus Hodarchaeota archaeon]
MAEFEEIYDVIIIGAGPGGYHSALRAAQYGAKVAVVEKKALGGTCSNVGCIPTKALYSASKLYEDLTKKSQDFGVDIPCDPQVNFERVVERKNEVVNKLVTGIEGLLKTRKIPVFYGFGRLEGGDVDAGFDVSVTDEDNTQTYIRGKRVIVATGSAPAMIPAFNIDHEKIITSDDILSPSFKTLPKSLLIIGAGVIGCEFGNIFASFGTKVTILEYLDTMLATEDKAIIRELSKKFKTLGIDVHTSQMVCSVEATENGVCATTADASTPRDQLECAEKCTFEAEMCLVSIGRAKQSMGLGLEEMGVKIERGQISVDRSTGETDVPGIYAIGDVTGGLMLAHVASHEGDVAVSNALAGIGGFDIQPETTNYAVVPYTIFTSPNIGSVGLTQKVAKINHKINVGRFFYGGLGKAMCMGEEEGFMMIIADAETDQILGATCIGAEAPELIAEIAVAMKNNLTSHQVASTIHSHPTISEMVKEASEDIYGMAIHKVGRPKKRPVHHVEGMVLDPTTTKQEDQ